MSTALGVQNAGSVGTTASDLRGIFWWEWENVGIVDKYGAAFPVTKTGLQYKVGEGLAVCSRGSGYGLVKAYWPGGTAGTVAANSSSYPRLDAIYVVAHDVSQGDADNLVAMGVAQGTPAATPQVPAIPTGATLVAVMSMPAGATSTTSATLYRKGEPAIPWGASYGILVDAVDTTNTTADAAGSNWGTYAQGTFVVPTERMVDVKRIFTLTSKDSTDASVYTRVLVDGEQVAYCEVRAETALATSQYMENTIRVSPGVHTIQAQMRKGVGSCRKYWSKGGWAGQALQVVDAGIAYASEG